MTGKQDTNILFKFYYMLKDAIINNLSIEPYISYDKIDDILKLILMNNGCKASTDNNISCKIYNLIPDEYNICFIKGMIGNDANEYYDYVVFDDMKYLIVFIDYFNNMITRDSEYDPNTDIMGNSIYYDALKNIVEIFYVTHYNICNAILRTSFANTMRWNKIIIAINILNSIKTVDDNDVTDVDPEIIKDIVSSNINLSLYGIRVM